MQWVFQETLMRHLLCLIALCTCATSWALEINQASEAELDNLRGLGPAFTRRIMAERQRQLFSSWADLMQRVSGMGTATARKLSDQGLTVQSEKFAADCRTLSALPSGAPHDCTRHGHTTKPLEICDCAAGSADQPRSAQHHQKSGRDSRQNHD